MKYSREGVPPIVRIKANPIDSSNIPDDRALSKRTYTHIRISDNGIGFDNDFSEKIFEVFQRLHGREKYRGTGVGLAIVKKIAENHKGFVTATGEPGQGTEINIYIPKRDTGNSGKQQVVG